MERLRVIPIPIFTQTVMNTTAAIPSRQTTEAYGYDVCAFLPEGDVSLSPLQIVRVRTGLHVALPEHSSLLVCSRSGLAAKGVQVINAPGIIDSDYRNEIQVLLTLIAPPDAPAFTITHGQRIAQLVYLPAFGIPDFEAVTAAAWQEQLRARELSRVGGFGSTGS